MDYKKFFNSNPSAAGNSAVTNVKALQEMQLWLGGQEIIDIKVGEAGDGYTPLTFTKENGDTYTVNIPTVQGKQGEQGEAGESCVNDITSGAISEDNGYTVTQLTFNFEIGNSKTVSVKAKNGEKGDKGDTGDTGVEALSIIKVYESETIPSVNSGVTLNVGDFNRTPTTNEQAIMFVITRDSSDVAKAYITGITVNTISDTTVNCMYNSVNEISTQAIINEFNYMGEWVSNNEYHKNDCVYITLPSTDFHTYYICIEDISNSTTTPNNDIMHWNVISTNISTYLQKSVHFDDNELSINSSGSITIGSNTYMHFVNIIGNGDAYVNATTFCITNSPNTPSIDDFISFLREGASGFTRLIATGYIFNGGIIVATVTGFYFLGGYVNVEGLYFEGA